MLPLRSDLLRRRADRLGDDPARRPRPGHRRGRGHPLPGRAADDLGRDAGALQAGPPKAEASGFPIVALILLVVFGSLAAAALPLALGFVSVLVTGALIYFISLQMTTSVFVTNMASMIGIGVAIDYSLFILARYREEREAGRDRDEARAEALATSGLAVSFSGLAVIISLAGLWMVDNQALRSMALGAMTVVAVSILDRDDAAAGADRDARRPCAAGRDRRQGPRFFKPRVFRRPEPSRPPRPRHGPASGTAGRGA